MMQSGFSTGLRNYVGDTGSLKTAMNNGFLDIFSAPTNPDIGPDDATTGATLLATLTLDGDGSTGLTFGTAVNGALPKATGHTWQGLILATGTAVFARFRAAGDSSTTASTTAKRAQGTVSTAGADINITAGVNLVANGTNTVGLDAFELDLLAA